MSGERIGRLQLRQPDFVRPADTERGGRIQARVRRRGPGAPRHGQVATEADAVLACRTPQAGTDRPPPGGLAQTAADRASRRRQSDHRMSMSMSMNTNGALGLQLAKALR